MRFLGNDKIYVNLILMTKCEFMTNALAPMGTASFFGIAGKCCKDDFSLFAMPKKI